MLRNPVRAYPYADCVMAMRPRRRTRLRTLRFALVWATELIGVLAVLFGLGAIL